MDSIDKEAKSEKDLAMGSDEIRNLLKYLQWVEECWCSDAVMRDIIQRLQQKVSLFNGDFSDIISKLKEEGILPDSSLSTHQKSRVIVLLSLENLKFIKPEMEQMYSHVFDCSKFMTPEGNKHVLSFFSSIHENLKQILISKAGILVPVKPRILALEFELRFLRNFLYFISEICIDHHFSKDLLSFAQAVAVNTAYLLHFLQVDEPMCEDAEIGVRDELLELVEKFNPVQQQVMREIYLRALEGTNLKLLDHDHTVMDYECALRFFDSVVENLGKMINNADLELTAKNQVDVLYEDLCSLRFYLMDLPLSDSNQKLLRKLGQG